MASSQEIANAIVTRMGQTKFNQWRIGLTHTPGNRRQEWTDGGHDTQHWTQWQADSLEHAQAVEAHFIAKGMDGGVGGNLDRKYITHVYIF
jgi:hypothetical protein